MQTTLDIDAHWANRRALTLKIPISLLIAAAVLLPLSAVILLSQRLSEPDASLIVSGITGFALPSLCRAAPGIGESRLKPFDREQIRTALHQTTGAAL